jgi:hypothetical protein
VCSQFTVGYNKAQETGGASPDFVALDFKRKDLVIAEVSSASSISQLISKIRERQQRWYSPIYASLLAESAINQEWPQPRFIGFIRSDNINDANRAIPDEDVCFYPLENVAFDYKFWDSRLEGMPRRKLKNRTEGGVR